MRPLYFSTGSAGKFDAASAVFNNYGIKLTQKELDISEIQSENLEDIIRDKLNKAYEKLKCPVIVSDDSWHILGLNGFPGPYMKSMNHWLSSEDLIRLTKDLSNREVVLTQQIGYQDSERSKLFTIDSHGQILKEARGDYGTSAHKVFAMDCDGGLSLAEYHDNGGTSTSRDDSKIWHEFAAWYCQKPRP